MKTEPFVVTGTIKFVNRFYNDDDTTVTEVEITFQDEFDNKHYLMLPACEFEIDRLLGNKVRLTLEFI